MNLLSELVVQREMLEMVPEKARRLKPLLRAALLVRPKSHYFVTGRYNGSSPTISNPVDINQRFDILVADITQ